MTTLWQILKPEDKMKLANLYRVLAGFPFVPPELSVHQVRTETKLESLKEIDKIMRQKPSGRPSA